MYDVIIRNGRIVDGTGNPWYVADVGIKGDKVAAIGNLKGESAAREIDAPGLTVAPGFIDIHTHSDFPLLVDGKGDSHIRQGVTTNVIGNCGISAAPLTEISRDYTEATVRESYPDFKIDWSTMGEYLDRLEKRGVSVNVVPLVGQGTVRGSVMGYAEREPSPEEMKKMKELVRQAMLDGAFGLSSGLIYTPGCYAKTGELVELAKVAAVGGGSYNTHIRGENDTLLDAVAEAIEIGRRAKIPVEISHFKAMGRHMWGKSVESLRMVDEARAEGIDVTADQYPYNASATGLSAYLPPWSHVGGAKALTERLRDPEQRARIKRDILEGLPGWISLHKGVGWENTLVTECRNHDLEGVSITEIAKRYGKDDFDMAFDLLIENDGRVEVVYFTIGDEDIERIMKHQAIMVGSDSSAISIEGPTATGKPHPRTFGTFVRVLGHYAREKKTITLEQAVRKMTSFPAQKMRLYDRGVLRPGFVADVVVFDAETVVDVATYTDPFKYPKGIEYVFVNGQETVRKGTHLGIKAGRVLRHRHK